MKKVYVIICVLGVNMLFYGCNPESISEEVNPQACCGENGEIPPPPPPPPPPIDPVD
ncbi:hypothetical protein [Meridianimaribacter flavus]|uniref:hypothetical protein n=1 Tax=Meridianimaribacter flavus TaxID=571115 RepID=UPI001416F8E4|nr:hypothetical protein [Meridianimaribacter flavus]